jgi:hypothetical protein
VETRKGDKMQLKAAERVFRKERDKHFAEVQRLDRILAAIDGEQPRRTKKRHMSAAVKAKIARKQRANWKAKRATGKA